MYILPLYPRTSHSRLCWLIPRENSKQKLISLRSKGKPNGRISPSSNFFFPAYHLQSTDSTRTGISSTPFLSILCCFITPSPRFSVVLRRKKQPGISHKVRRLRYGSTSRRKSRRLRDVRTLTNGMPRLWYSTGARLRTDGVFTHRGEG